MYIYLEPVLQESFITVVYFNTVVFCLLSKVSFVKLCFLLKVRSCDDKEKSVYVVKYV